MCSVTSIYVPNWMSCSKWIRTSGVCSVQSVLGLVVCVVLETEVVLWLKRETFYYRNKHYNLCSCVDQHTISL